MTQRIVLVTGGFDPLHSGHISYFKAARQLGDWIIVGVNSDAWLTRKKGKPFLPIWERVAIISELKCVDQVVALGNATDADGSACTFIKETLDLYTYSDIIFANGGDRNQGNIPELSIKHPRLTFEFGVGGDYKQNSSSLLLANWKSDNFTKFD